jgi:hypothetical protein
MVVQAIWIGAFIVVAVGLVVWLLLFLARRSAGCPAERTATVSSNGVKTDRITFSILPGSPSLYLPVDR